MNTTRRLSDVPIGAVFQYDYQLFRRGKWKSSDDDDPCADLVFTGMPLTGHGGLRAIPESYYVYVLEGAES
jgi:hypothetical protein